MSLIALGIDPGKTTGFCWAIITDKIVFMPFQQEFSLFEMYELLTSDLGTLDESYVIYESFQYRNQSRKGLDLTPVKLIGVIELVEQLLGNRVHFYSQTAATGKAFYSNDRLKQMGLYVPSTPHGLDAMRHVLQSMTFGALSQFVDVEKADMKVAPWTTGTFSIVPEWLKNK